MYRQSNSLSTSSNQIDLKLPTSKMLRKVCLLVFFIAGFSVGLYKYLDQGVYHSYSQWDLRSHVVAAHNLLLASESGNPAVAQNPFLPPYPPLAFPLLSLFGKLDWHTARQLWLLLMSIALLLAVRWQVENVDRRSGSPGGAHLLLIAAGVWLFKGTFLALAAGQISLLAAFLLLLHWKLRDDHPLASGILLALGMIKINLALPFLVFLIFRKKHHLLLITAGAAALFNLLSLAAFSNTGDYFQYLLTSIRNFESTGVNSYLLKAASGRIDLAPLAATLGVSGRPLTVCLAAVFLAGIFYLYRRQPDEQRLLLALNTLFFMIIYHRDYDLPLILLIAIPLLWECRRQFRAWEIAAFLPIVLPLHRIYAQGIAAFPGAAGLWNFIGGATVIALVVFTFSIDAHGQNGMKPNAAN